jgi:hypothetical protein
MPWSQFCEISYLVRPISEKRKMVKATAPKVVPRWRLYCWHARILLSSQRGIVSPSPRDIYGNIAGSSDHGIPGSANNAAARHR